MREIKFRAWGPNSKFMWNWQQVKKIADDLGWEHFEDGERVLMQYTGLKDGRGKEIYEGDIVKSSLINACEIVFRNGCFCLKGRGGGIASLYDDAPTSYNWLVIGNIYENPEMVKEQD